MEDVQNGCAARCGGDLHKSAKYHMYGEAHSSMPPLCKVLHLRFTSDIKRVKRSRAERRSSWSGLRESRIDDLARFGIRRHLR